MTSHVGTRQPSDRSNELFRKRASRFHRTQSAPPTWQRLVRGSDLGCRGMWGLRVDGKSNGGLRATMHWGSTVT